MRERGRVVGLAIFAIFELGPHRPKRAKVSADSSPHGALVGRVINWSTRLGVAHAELGFVQDGTTHTLSADADGNFRFVAPGPGTWLLATILADGYLPYAPELGRGSVRFVAQSGQRIEHADLFLFPAIDYHGRVVDAAGEPVAGAEIELFAADSGERTLVGIESSFRSDSDGKFVFHAPDYAVLEARHPDHASGRAMLDDAAQLSHTLTIQLGQPDMGASEAGAPIRGRVVDAQGYAATASPRSRSSMCAASSCSRGSVQAPTSCKRSRKATPARNR